MGFARVKVNKGEIDLAKSLLEKANKLDPECISIIFQLTHLNHYSLDTSFSKKVVFIRCAIIAKGNSSPVAFGPG